MIKVVPQSYIFAGGHGHFSGVVVISMTTQANEVPTEAVQLPVEQATDENTAVISKITETPEVVDQDMEAQDAAVPRPEALHIIGVNELSQVQVQEFITEFTSDLFSIEWIDDESVNIVFDTPAIARRALKSITEDWNDNVPLSEIRSTKPHPSIACNFRVRQATSLDVKPDNSKELSRYYLLHGAPSRQENQIRFGTNRSAPMKYGKGDIMKKKKKSKSTDLFPHLARGAGAADDLFPHLARGGSKDDDLFPHLVKGGGVKKNGGRRRGGRNRAKKLEDKMDMDLEQPQHNTADETKPKTEEEAPSVYSNMDY